MMKKMKSQVENYNDLQASMLATHLNALLGEQSEIAFTAPVDMYCIS